MLNRFHMGNAVVRFVHLAGLAQAEGDGAFRNPERYPASDDKSPYHCDSIQGGSARLLDCMKGKPAGWFTEAHPEHRYSRFGGVFRGFAGMLRSSLISLLGRWYHMPPSFVSARLPNLYAGESIGHTQHVSSI